MTGAIDVSEWPDELPPRVMKALIEDLEREGSPE
jgi:hypothetical protein